MTLRSIHVAASVGVLLLAGGALAFERVVLQLPTGVAAPAPPEYGILLFSPSTVHIFGPGVPPFDIGSPDSRLTSLVAFTEGLPPVLATRTPGRDATLTFSPPVTIPLKIWVLCLNANCDDNSTKKLEDLKGNMESFLFKANDLLERERTGLVLSQADGADWISDQTRNDQKRKQFKNFTTGDGVDDCSLLTQLTDDQMKKTRALNLYLVGRVEGEAGRGESCLEQDIAVVGATTSWHTKLHEIGHNLGLLHVDGTQIKKYKPCQNLMYKASSDRRFLSEGQTFLIYFDGQSALNNFKTRTFPGVLPKPWPDPLDCSAKKPDCPPLTTWIWDDQD